jgi:hypothetical protein
MINSNDHEVKFHEIEIAIFHEIEITIMRSKLCFFMRSNLSNNFDQEVDTLIMRSNPKQALLGNFDLMIDLLVASTIMRLNVFIHRWLIIRAKNQPQVQLTKFK